MGKLTVINGIFLFLNFSLSIVFVELFIVYLGKPYRLVPGEENQPLFLERKFRQACVWSSFTIDRTKTAWKYNVFLCE